MKKPHKCNDRLAIRRKLNSCETANFNDNIVLLIYLAMSHFEKANSYPGNEDFPTLESWNIYARGIAEDLKPYLDDRSGKKMLTDSKEIQKVYTKADKAMKRFVKHWAHFWI